MRRQKYRVPFSKSFLEFILPPDMRATVISSQSAQPVKDVGNAIREVLAHPIGTRPLHELAGPGTRACIVFTDIARACPGPPAGSCSPGRIGESRSQAGRYNPSLWGWHA